MILDILEVIHEDDGDAQAEDRNAPPARRLVPECLLQLARKVCPFWWGSRIHLLSSVSGGASWSLRCKFSSRCSQEFGHSPCKVKSSNPKKDSSSSPMSAIQQMLHKWQKQASWAAPCKTKIEYAWSWFPSNHPGSYKLQQLTKFAPPEEQSAHTRVWEANIESILYSFRLEV